MSEKKNTQKPRHSSYSIVAILVALLMVVLSRVGVSLPDGAREVASVGTTAATMATEAPTATHAAAITAPQDIADYLFAYGKLPDNFLTKSEAKERGWDSSRNYVSDVAPGYAIGGDRFGNYEGLLPDKAGRKWYEADANYLSGPRGAERILYSSDGLVYYTADHYQTFTQMQPSGQ